MNTPTGTLRVFVNDEPRDVEAGAGLVALLRSLGVAERAGIAVACNGGVVPRASWGSCVLGDGDRVLIIQATQGG